MNTIFRKMIIASVILMSGSLALGQISDARVKNVSGSHCNLNSVGIAFSPDLKDVSIVYDELKLEVNGNSPQGQASCIVSVEFDIDPNYTLNIYGIDVRGFHTPSSLVTTKLSITHSGTNGAGNGRNLNSDTRLPTNSQDFLIHSKLPNPELRSVCVPGQNISRLTFTVGLRILTTKNRPGNILTVIDSTDYASKSQVKYSSKIVRNANPCK